MLLELEVYYFPDDYNPEVEDNLGRKPKLKKGIIVIITEHVCAFHPNDKDETMIRLTNGDVFTSTMNFFDFRKIMEEAQIAKDMLVSGHN